MAEVERLVLEATVVAEMEAGSGVQEVVREVSADWAVELVACSNRTFESLVAGFELLQAATKEP